MPYTHASLGLRIAFGLWALFLVTWILASGWAAHTERTPGRESERLYLLMNAIGWVGMFVPPGGPLSPPLWTNPVEVQWVLDALVAVGFAFCWWARIHLGRLWSGSVTRKEDHRVVDTGPYRLVRHPIYSGIILASASLAALSTTALAIAGFVLSSLGFWIKARLEERFLLDELGEAYAIFCARTPMLAPFLPGRRPASRPPVDPQAPGRAPTSPPP